MSRGPIHLSLCVLGFVWVFRQANSHLVATPRSELNLVCRRVRKLRHSRVLAMGGVPHLRDLRVKASSLIYSQFKKLPELVTLSHTLYADPPRVPNVGYASFGVLNPESRAGEGQVLVSARVGPSTTSSRKQRNGYPSLGFRFISIMSLVDTSGAIWMAFVSAGDPKGITPLP